MQIINFYIPQIEKLKWQLQDYLDIPIKLIHVEPKQDGSIISFNVMIDLKTDQHYFSISYRGLKKLEKDYDISSLYHKDSGIEIHMWKKDLFDKTIGRLTGG